MAYVATLLYETLMSENKWPTINYKECIVATYLRYGGGFVDLQINKCLLISLSVNFF